MALASNRGNAVVIEGVGALNRSFRRIDSDLYGELKDQWAKVAEPVAAKARALIGEDVGAITQTIQPKVLTRGVMVRQSQRKRGGAHPTFGTWQMLQLLVALGEHASEIQERAEDALDYLARREGLT